MDEKEQNPTTDTGEPAEDDLEEASHSTADYAKFEKPTKQPNPIWKKLVIGLASLLLLVGLVAGSFWYLSNHKSAKKAETTLESTQTTPTPVASQISTTIAHHDATTFRLGFDAPSDWQITDKGGTELYVRSPVIKLKSADGQTVDGQIIMFIQTNDSKLPEFGAGNATAVRPSKKVDYTKPTSTQRGSTYLSFLRYAKTTNATALDGIYITGDNGYTLGQAIPKVDVQKVDPIINITFAKCEGEGCGDPLSISASSWDDATFSTPLENILKSLSIN